MTSAGSGGAALTISDLSYAYDGITALRLSDAIVGRLRRAGFDDRTAVEILTNLGSFMIGFTLTQRGRIGTAAKDPLQRSARLREQQADQ